MIREAVYKKAGGIELTMDFYIPKEAYYPAPYPVVLFFFGGGFNTGTPLQFKPQSEFFAAHGIAGVTADYRVKSRHGATPSDSLADAADALAWVHGHASMISLNPDKIIAAGGSSGGYLAGSLVLSGTAPVIGAALFNPLIDPHATVVFDGIPTLMGQTTGKPIVIFQGEADETTPLSVAERFAGNLNAEGGDCTLHTYPGEKHGFFNYDKKDDRRFKDTVHKLHDFLKRIV
jgi:acetyl esterase/lipase